MDELRDLLIQLSHSSNNNLPRIVFLRNIFRKLIKAYKCDEIELWLFDFVKGKVNSGEIIKQAKNSFHYDHVFETQPGKNRIQYQGNTALNLKKMWGVAKNARLNHYPPLAGGKAAGSGLMRYPAHFHLIDNTRIFSFAVIPLSERNRRTGLLVLKDRRTDFFEKQEFSLHENFAETISIILINQRAQAALHERVKELTCMYGIAQAATWAGVSKQEILRNAVNLLPRAWQYPEIAQGKITLDGNIFLTADFKPEARKGMQKQSAKLVINGTERGEIEVGYRVKKPDIDEGPFLKEERQLINNIANALSLVIEQKEIEEEKAKLHQQIRHTERLATIGQLSAGVAHELNEPLGNILGFAQLVKKEADIPAKIEADVEKIINASLHAREIVRKLLFFARQMPTTRTRISLNQIIEEGLYFLASRCAKEGVELRRILDDRISDIIADPSQMTQVLVNLVVNAIQSMPSGGILIVQTYEKDNFVFLVIQDTGTGMSDDLMKQIFLPFFTTKEVGQGTGLGLSVVHGIVTSHNGAIHVDSTPGKGSRFEISLPSCGSDYENEQS